MRNSFLLLFALVSLWKTSRGLKATVFGASGGVGQLICRSLKSVKGIDTVTAVSRNINSLATFDLLKGCQFVEADALKTESLKPALDGADFVIISVGTTAFPTSKWKGGNTPQVACVDTVESILRGIANSKRRPKKVILLSSIGVERADQFPFKILNTFGVLDAKRDSEKLLFRESEKQGFDAIIVRPGRLVGAPFTNFDLAKLFNIDQGSNKGIVIDKDDVLAGDVERADVATVISKLIGAKMATKRTIFSVINKTGNEPSDGEWRQILAPLVSGTI